MAGSVARNGHQRHEVPEQDQAERQPKRLSPRLEVQVDDPAEEIAERDPLQHTGDADIGPRLGEPPVEKDAQRKEDDRPSDEMPVEGRSTLAPREALRERERNRNAHHEDEQRENQIVEDNPVPLDVLQLPGGELED